jgi:hypothetical protein
MAIVVDDALVYLLKTLPVVLSKVGDRIYHLDAQGTVGRPYITYQQTGRVRDRTLAGASGLTQTTFALTYTGPVGRQLKDIALAVEALENTPRGMLNNLVFIEKVLVDDASDEFTPPQQGQQRGDKAIRQMVVIWHQRET